MLGMKTQLFFALNLSYFYHNNILLDITNLAIHSLEIVINEAKTTTNIKI